ncbi:MAG: hypothetical protein R2748_32440 [Bryobacterales bacterium]
MRHRADAHEPDIVFADVVAQLRFGHRPGVAVDEEDLVAGRRQPLEENIQRCGMKLRVITLSGL